MRAIVKKVGWVQLLSGNRAGSVVWRGCVGYVEVASRPGREPCGRELVFARQSANQTPPEIIFSISPFSSSLCFWISSESRLGNSREISRGLISWSFFSLAFWLLAWRLKRDKRHRQTRQGHPRATTGDEGREGGMYWTGSLSFTCDGMCWWQRLEPVYNREPDWINDQKLTIHLHRKDLFKSD